MPYCSLYYHLVWSTKYRLPLIDPVWETDLYGYIRGKAAFLGCHLYAIGGMPDHVHLAISIHPKLAVAAVVGRIKGASSHFVNETHLRGSFAWQTEYGAFTFSKRALAVIKTYINNQRQHHAANTLRYDLETSAEGA